MAKDYKVVSAVKTGTYDSQYGEDVDGKKVMFKYAVELEGESDGVEVSQKPSTAAPKPGDTLTGTIEAGKYGRKFKKEQKGGGSWGGGGGGVDPETSNKQSALSTAAQTAGAYFQALAVIDPERAKKEFPKNIKEFVGVQNALAVLHLKFMSKTTEELTGIKPKVETSDEGSSDVQKVADVMPGAEEVDATDVSAELDKLDL